MSRKGIPKHKFSDWAGQKVGSRTVVAEAEVRHGMYRWRVRCDCGDEVAVYAAAFVAGRFRSCVPCAAARRLGAQNSSFSGFGPVTGTSFCVFRNAAEKRGIPFLITIEEVAAMYDRQAGRCALTGWPLVFKDYLHQGNASLDRKDSGGAYTVANLQLVDKRINLAKRSLSDEEFVALCRAVAGWAEHGAQMAPLSAVA